MVVVFHLVFDVRFHKASANIIAGNVSTTQEIFVLSSFPRQHVDNKENGNSSAKLVTGEALIIRDFNYVRAVVAFYDLLRKKSSTGKIYNGK